MPGIGRRTWHHASPMRVRPYVDLLRHNPAFTRLYSARLISFVGDWYATPAT